jgi:hypothetical protein
VLNTGGEGNAMARRRRMLLASSAAALVAPVLLDRAPAWAQQSPFKPENDAELVLLRGATFLPAEGETTAAHVAGPRCGSSTSTRTISSPRWRSPRRSAPAPKDAMEQAQRQAERIYRK